MKTKIVYAVTSDNTDIYLEQTYVSIYSLRKFHPDAHIALVVDDITDKTIVGVREYILKEITEKIVVIPPQDYTKVERSRFLKTTLRSQIDGDYLFIDSDTVIVSNLDAIDSFEEDICAVIDYHVPLNQHSMFDSTINVQANKIDWIISESDYNYYNSGVLYVKDKEKTRELYHKWHEEWEKSISRGFHSDQPSLGKVNKEMGYVIHEMDGVWNCQIAANGLRFYENAKIIHYFSSTIKNHDKNNVYALMNCEVFINLKNKGEMGEALTLMLDHPKSLFPNQIIILTGENLRIFNTALITYMYVLYSKYRNVFKIFNWPFEKYAQFKRH